MCVLDGSRTGLPLGCDLPHPRQIPKRCRWAGPKAAIAAVDMRHQDGKAKRTWCERMHVARTKTVPRTNYQLTTVAVPVCGTTQKNKVHSSNHLCVGTASQQLNSNWSHGRSLHSQTFPQTTNPCRKTGAPPLGFLPRAQISIK